MSDDVEVEFTRYFEGLPFECQEDIIRRLSKINRRQRGEKQ